ncbi:unnamed protein product [Hyaloperonospora brassicae]|uniref:RxLR effector candidate protein n=1 Tax=Hyaloperonospora brassicae TaxID=162125 RepID=A0AAV0TWI9_HYABA|nr:unnamed protein product [Hyaloperonospora brassicae]
MRPAIFLSAALLCLVTCGNAVKAALDLQNPISSDVSSPVVANDNRVQSDESTKQRRLFSTWEEKDSESDDDSPAAAEDSTAKDAQFGNTGAPARESTYAPDSDSNLVSLSVPHRFGDRVLPGPHSKRRFRKRRYWFAMKYARYFYSKHRNRAQVLQKLALNQLKGGLIARYSTFINEGYLDYLDFQCANPINKLELACA